MGRRPWVGLRRFDGCRNPSGTPSPVENWLVKMHSKSLLGGQMRYPFSGTLTSSVLSCSGCQSLLRSNLIPIYCVLISSAWEVDGVEKSQDCRRLL